MKVFGAGTGVGGKDLVFHHFLGSSTLDVFCLQPASLLHGSTAAGSCPAGQGGEHQWLRVRPPLCFSHPPWVRFPAESSSVGEIGEWGELVASGNRFGLGPCKLGGKAALKDRQALVCLITVEQPRFELMPCRIMSVRLSLSCDTAVRHSCLCAHAGSRSPGSAPRNETQLPRQRLRRGIPPEMPAPWVRSVWL